MRTEKLRFKFPKELIAEKPIYPRDMAKLLVLDKKSGRITHAKFFDLNSFLRPGDVLVFNKSKVFPARCFGMKDTGGKIEVVFASEIESKVWEVMIGGKVKSGQKIIFDKEFSGEVLGEKGNFKLKVNLRKSDVYKKLEEIGQMPLPPYIKRKVTRKDQVDYQTVFAKFLGSAAAPTAGLHFTKRLIEKLKKKGIEIEYVTLHVGLGTFAPIKTEKVEDHQIHSEYFEIDKSTIKRIQKAKKEGKRVIAVGTTSLRAMESSASILRSLRPQKTEKETKLFIYPGYKFKIVDGLVTNFHTPHSSLLALVFAFAGEKNIRKTYTEAIAKKYRLFSYGDGMLIV